MPTVAVSRILPGNTLEQLRASVEVRVWEEDRPPDRGELLALVRGVDGILSMVSDRIDAEVLDAAGHISVVSNMAVGVDNIDVDELTRRGIPLGHTPGVLTDATADLAFALILAVSRRIVESHVALRAGEWKNWSPSLFLGLELAGSTLGIVGTGEIGRAVIERALGFGMRILATSRTEREIDRVTYVSLADLLAESDIVSLHVALTPETRHLIGSAELTAMKPGALLVNTTRGPVVDQAALFDALVSGHLGGAGLDVFAVEPVPLDDPLLTLANCVTVPHIGSATVRTRSAMARLAVENAIAGIEGSPLVRCVNPEVYSLGG